MRAWSHCERADECASGLACGRFLGGVVGTVAGGPVGSPRPKGFHTSSALGQGAFRPGTSQAFTPESHSAATRGERVGGRRDRRWRTSLSPPGQKASNVIGARPGGIQTWTCHGHGDIARHTFSALALVSLPAGSPGWRVGLRLNGRFIPSPRCHPSRVGFRHFARQLGGVLVANPVLVHHRPGSGFWSLPSLAGETGNQTHAGPPGYRCTKVLRLRTWFSGRRGCFAAGTPLGWCSRGLFERLCGAVRIRLRR